MGKLLFGLLAVALIAYVTWDRYASEPLDARETISAGVEQIKSSTTLEPAQEQLLRVQLAISDYMASHNGNAPETLASLVPKYFDSIPVDPETGEDYEYAYDGRTYRLGAQIAAAADRASTEKLVDSDPKKKAKSKKGSGVEDEADFVNPNTMTIEDFVYDPSGKRNPFEPFDFSGTVEYDESVPPIERFALGQLKVTAILSTVGSRRAIVEDQTGRGYTVKTGSRIGNNNGVVVSITEDRVNVVETNIDFTGKENQRVVEMRIQPSVNKPSTKKGRKKTRVFN